MAGGRLAGKVALVTGSGGPMGRAVAKRFAEEGASVAICDVSGARVNEAADEIRPKLLQGAKLVSKRMNALFEKDILEFCAEVEQDLGPVDILANIVGGIAPGGSFESPVVEIPTERWGATFELNIKPSVMLVKRVCPSMMQRGYGRVVNIASVDGHGQALRADYAAAKAGVMAFTRALAVELSPSVLVNCIAPGVINTRAMMGFGKTKDEQQENPAFKSYVNRSILKRHGEPVEIANAALFLASEECSYMTGECLRISGGIQANL